MKKIFSIVTKGYHFKKSVDNCLKQPADSEEFILAQFYKTELERQDDANIDIIDKLIHRVQDDKTKHISSEHAQDLLSNVASFLEALKAVAEK